MRALLLVVLLAPSALAAGAYPDPDEAARWFTSRCFATYDRRFVHDTLGVVGPKYGHEIEGAACDVYERTGAHFVLVTVQDTGGEPLESYALHLFERWGVGDKDRLDGLMLLYVREYALEGRASAVRIEAGYGIEGVITPPLAAQTLDRMRDARDTALSAGWSDADALDHALATGSWVLLTALHDAYADGAFPQASRDPFVRARAVPPAVWIGAAILVLVLILALSSNSRRPRRGWGYYPGSPQWSTGLGGALAGSWSGGGGWGGGGGLGGGRSGGGGGSGGL